MTSKKQDRGPERVPIRQLRTGVPGLDEILGGGLPEYSFNIIAGGPGCGKTTLVHQIMFANAAQQVPALYFTVLGEPAIKMLRYQQQYSFFDLTKIDGAIRFINLSHVVLDQDLSAVLDAIVREVEAANARIVVVDSFRTVVRKAQAVASEMELQGFVQRLALHLTSWQATSFLVGEYVEGEIRHLVPVRRHRAPALRLDQRAAAQDADGGQDAFERAQHRQAEGYALVTNGYRPLAGLPEAIESWLAATQASELGNATSSPP